MFLFNYFTYIHYFLLLIDLLEIILEFKILILDLIFVIGIISLAGRIGKEALTITNQILGTAASGLILAP